jgi:hypothetical protein
VLPATRHEQAKSSILNRAGTEIVRPGGVSFMNTVAFCGLPAAAIEAGLELSRRVSERRMPLTCAEGRSAPGSPAGVHRSASVWAG